MEQDFLEALHRADPHLGVLVQQPGQQILYFGGETDVVGES